MATYESTLRAELSFGDVCDADFLYDVHVRDDANALGRAEMPAAFAARRFQIDTDGQPLPYFVPAVAPGAGRTEVLAHGIRQPAAVLSDDCHIATVLGREHGRPTSRRLLFAPVVDAAGRDEIAELQEANFGRFPLPGDPTFDTDQVIDLRRCFMADARAVHRALADEGFRLRSLAGETQAELAIRLSAYTVRRGPFVAEDSLEKFAELLVAAGVADDPAAVAAASKLADVVAAAWGYEGRGVEAAGSAAEEGTPPREIVELLIAKLTQLRGAADDALATLQGLTATETVS